MPNSLLTPSIITREALRILHQKLNFVGNINRQYDGEFAKSGAKIGDTLRVRLPNKYTIRNGSALATQNTNENQVPLTISTQKGVDTLFTSKELTLDLDDFSKRILEPAMAVLAANIEADALTMINDVYNTVGTPLNPISWKDGVLASRKALNDNLAPMDDKRHILLNTQDNMDLVDNLKGLFHSATQIEKQYKDGMMGRTGGFNFYENTLMPSMMTGNAVGGLTGHTVNGAVTVNGSNTVVLTGALAGDYNVGDVITFQTCNRVHPETKQDTGKEQQFVITSQVGTTITVSPAVYTSGAMQNVIATGIPNLAPVKKVGVPATAGNDIYNHSLAFHEDAFTFATADLIMPKGVHFAAREVYDGISMRIVQAYDINSDTMPCRIDVLYGYKALRPELACRILAN